MAESTPAEIELMKVYADIARRYPFDYATAAEMANELADAIRADEREQIAQAIEAKADAHNARIAEIAGVPNRGRDGMTSGGIRSAALIARDHARELFTETGPRCQYCGADCSGGRNWHGGDQYTCPECST